MALTITKSSNCTYTLNNGEVGTVDYTISSVTSDGNLTEVDSGTIAGGGGTVDYVFTSDGVYKVEDTSGDIIVLFVDCDLETCKTSFIDDILCKAACDITNFSSLAVVEMLYRHLIDSDTALKNNTAIDSNAYNAKESKILNIRLLMLRQGTYCTIFTNECNC